MTSNYNPTKGCCLGQPRKGMNGAICLASARDVGQLPAGEKRKRWQKQILLA